MSMEVLERDHRDPDETRDTLLLLGGAAFMLLGAGLILSNSAVRRYLSSRGIDDLIQQAVPAFERYIKPR